jgi:RNA polymerase sigma-70 factor (ECF subfamily)
MDASEQGPTSEDLLRAKAGDRSAFEEQLAPILEPAFRLAMTMLRDRSAAEDAVQEAALKAWTRIHRFRSGSGSDLRPWFLAIVANECRSVRRSRWWHVIRSSDIPAPSLVDQVEIALAERLDLDRALDRLPRRHLLVLVLYYHLDLPIDEVARVLGCSRNAAKVRIHRALKTLRPGLLMEVNR